MKLIKIYFFVDSTNHLCMQIVTTYVKIKIKHRNCFLNKKYALKIIDLCTKTNSEFKKVLIS